MTHQVQRLAFVLLAGTALTACAAQTPKPNFPITQPETPGPVATAPSAVPPASSDARPSTPVQTAPLPPPVGSSPMAPLAPAAPPRPAEQTVTRTVATGKVVDMDGPAQTYTVKSGDTVYAVGRHFGIPPKQVMELNGLKEPFVIRPGQTLKGPGGTTKGYQVASGDSLFAIARRFSVSPQALAEANEIQVSSTIRPGQRLTLPAGYSDRGPQQVQVKVAAPPPPAPPPYTPPAYTPPAYAPPPATAAAPPPPPPPPVTPPPAAPPRPAQTAQSPATTPYNPLPPKLPPEPAAPPPPATSTPPSSSAPPIVPSSAPVPDSQIATLGKGRFVWPVRGDVISGFGPKGAGQRNDGVNIRASNGTPVRAAAAGDVVYAGDQVPGFGNLVLVKHTDGWVTAYGHLSTVDVKMQQKVVQGQSLGAVGSSGGVGEPQLHFEVRYAPTVKDRAKPIDPQLVLPK